MRAGWEPDYVLDLPLDSFTEVLLVVQKQMLQLQMHLGTTIMMAAGALFSKDGAQKSLDAVQEQVTKIDEVLLPDDEEETEYEYDEPTPGRRRRKRGKRPVDRGQRMVQRFHKQFSDYIRVTTGQQIPGLDVALKKRAAHNAQLLSKTEAQTE